MDAMAEAVENSSVVLVAVSRLYRDSANCQAGQIALGTHFLLNICTINIPLFKMKVKIL